MQNEKLENLKVILTHIKKEKGYKHQKELAEYITENTDTFPLPNCPHKPAGCKNSLWHEVLCLGLSANTASELVFS